ncbi:glycosyltransferase [Abditibacterium utsteinense]|uniref:glycosyltransferase n=1 Tax=Abditibacterium utsteinense TaxID=1960156 RepID=UPI000F491EEA|nr:hypothetical protein [Abditibacterium utsteinense]
MGALENQSLPRSRFEVLVGDWGCFDDTNEVLSHFDGCGHLNLRAESISRDESEARAWNYLIEKARGGILLFLGDNLIAHPPLLVQHLMAHLEGESLICSAPMPHVHSHVFPIQSFPVPDLRPSPLVSSGQAQWMEYLAPLVCSLDPIIEIQPTSWLDFDLSHASVRRETWVKVGPFRGEIPKEDFGSWGLLSRDFSVRAYKQGVNSRPLPSPAAWQGLKPNFVVDVSLAHRHLQRFFSHHTELDRPTLEPQLHERFLPSALPAWSV